MITEEYLKLIYEKLESEIIRSLKGKKSDTVFKSLLKAKSNKVFDVLLKSSIEESDIPREDLQSLLNNKWLEMVLDNANLTRRYILTTKGMWAHEDRIGRINLEILLDIIQSTNFDFSKINEPLIEKEIVILIALLIFRVFNKSTAMDLKSPQKCNSWLDAIKEIDQLALQSNLIKNSILKNKKFGLEHPVSYLMRRVNDLTKKTNNIFCSPGNQTYYLSIYENDQTKLEKILFLWGKILPNYLNIEKRIRFIEEVEIIKEKYMVYICDNFEMFDANWNNLIESIKYRIDYK